MVTIDDVARRAGLSKAVVSSVIGGGSSNVRYSESTRRKVLRAASELDYKPRVAHGIGIIHCVGSKDPHQVDWVHWLSPMLASIHTEALADNKLVSLFSYSAAELDRLLATGEKPQILKRRKIDGLIVSGLLDRNLVGHMAESRVPYILMNINDSHTHWEDSICFDETFTGGQATRFLIERGHRRILHVSVRWTNEHYSVSGRRQGYEQAMTDAGLAPQVIEHFENRDALPAAEFLCELREILTGPEPPTAIFAYNEVVATGIYRALHQLASARVELMAACWQDPRGMALLGISHVELPAFEMGKLAFRMLLEKLTTGQPVPTICLRGVVRRLQDADGWENSRETADGGRTKS
ncbi:MAG: LacI family transcriptional regulator [Phycisphaerae bacterium]|nr:LacI family transcriptional regulator [Phycisphaerae bacterium]